jgi:hypothetical protein
VKYTPKNSVSVEGKMSEQAADKVGNKFANAALIFAVGVALAALIHAIRWW